MPYYEKAEDWLHQSTLLLQARPSTTRITTRYHLKPARRTPKSKKTQTKDATSSTSQTQQQQSQSQPPQEQETKPPRGHLVLKTFDPHSGVTLKYKTSKAAEVSRLVQMLGTLGKRMAGVPVPVPAPAQQQQQGEDVTMADAAGGVAEREGGASAVGSGVQTPVSRGEAPLVGVGQGGTAAGAAAGGGGGGGKGKKKKGKR